MNFKTLLFGTLMLAGAMESKADSDEFYYYNPVIAKDAPDPTVFKYDGYYYLFHTGSLVPIYRSKDMVNWKFFSNSFTNDKRPTFVTGGGVWAPDINYVNGQCVMYYSMSTWGGEWECGIGVATSSSPKAKFTDHGKLFISSEIGVQNSIDPFFYEEEDGSKYLFWGSFRGIYAIQLSDDGLSLMEGAQKKQIAGTLTEGTYIYKHGEYYYLFGSAGSCCDGVNSTYRLVVARSKNLLGPYVDKSGKGALSNGFSEILHKSDYVVGPGHCSEIMEDDAGRTWIMYHGYQKDAIDKGRCAFLDEVLWDNNGWPYITGERPSVSWDKPVMGEDNATYSDVDYIEYVGEDDRYGHFFDTGYQAVKNSKFEFDCYTYPENYAEESTDGKWRAIYSGRTSYNNGASMYVNPDGEHFGYFVGGYINDNFAPHEYEKMYHVNAGLSSVVYNDDKYDTGRTAFTAGQQRITLFAGTEDWPYIGRIYNFSIYQGDELVADFIPRLRNDDEMLMFYDKVSGRYVRPYYFDGFDYGSIVDDIKDVDMFYTINDGTMYNLAGQKVANAGKGIYIKNGRKYIK